MSRLRLGFVVLVALVVCATAFLLFSNTLLGEDYLKEFVLQQLEESLGRKIEVHRIKFVWFPRIRVELSQVAVHDPHSDEVMLKAKRIDLVLRLLPLLRKQVVGKRLLVEEPVLTIHRNDAGHWNVLDNANQAATDQRTLDMISRVFMIRQATVVNGSITVIDEGRPGGTRTLKLERVEGGMMIRPERAMADVHLSVAQTGQDGLSAVSLVGQIKRVERSAPLTTDESVGPVLTEPPPASTPTSVFQFEGQVDAANVVLREMADFFGPRPVPDQLDGLIDLQGQVRIMPGLTGYDAVLSSMTARLNQLTLTGKANLAGLLTAQPTFAITFNSSLVTLKELLNTIPVQWIHPQLPTVLAERQIDGKVQVVNATLTGSAATSGPQLSVIGEFHVQEGQALLGEENVLTKDLAGAIVVETGRVRAANFTGTYGAIQITEGKATVSFLEAGPWLELEITGSMAATDLVQLLAKTVKAERVAHLLAGLRDVEGTALPTFRLLGPLNEPGGVTFAGGEITARYISFTHPSLPERLTALQGKFVLADGGTRFEQVTGHLGDTIIQAQGGLSGGAASVFQDFVIRANGDAGHIARFAPSKVIPVGMFEGMLSGAVQLSGAATAPHVRGNVVLTDSKVVVPSVIEKPVGAPAVLEFEGDLTRANAATVTRVELLLPSVRIPVKGVIRVGEKFSIDATVATGELSLSGLPEWVAKGGIEAGTVEVSLDVKGKDTDWKTWKTTGWMALTNGLMLVKGGGHLDDLYARVKLVRNGAEVKRLSFKVQDSDLALEATVRNWPSKPVITGKIESNQLDLDLVIPKGERSPMRELLETLASSSQVTMTASAARAHYRHLKFGGLTARITIQDGVLDIDRISGDSTKGQVAGRVVVQLPPKAPAETEVSLRATGVAVEDLLQLTHADVQGFSGQVRLTGTIRGHGRNPHGVYPSLNGKAEILLENGRILKAKERAIWKILSILNLPAVLQGKVDLDKEGLPYNRISATVRIQNGSFQTENLVVDSPILKITAAGNYDLPTDQLDMMVAVSPFGSYATFLKTIPLFGRIFAGDRKGVATAIFSIKGAVEDPEVTYLPMKSFTTGLSSLAQLAVDVLRNTLTLPMDLMTPNEERPATPELEFVPEAAPATP